MGDKDYAIFEDCLRRTTRIVRYLIDILDMRQPLAQDLWDIYTYLIYDVSLIKSGRERRKDEIGRISHILSELRDAFEQAGRKVSDSHYVQRKSVQG